MKCFEKPPICLNLSKTNLKRFNVTEMTLPKYLRRLDISHNDLEQVDFSSQLMELEFLDLRGNNLAELDTFQPQFRTLKYLAISKNQLSCEYLSAFLNKVKETWPELKIIGDPWDQKHGEDCHPKLPTNSTEIAWNEEPNNFNWMFLVSLLVTGVIFSSGFVIYRRVFGRNNNSNNLEEKDTRSAVATRSGDIEIHNNSGADLHIYEEIQPRDDAERNLYDKLCYYNNPLPLLDIRTHYDNFRLFEREISYQNL